MNMKRGIAGKPEAVQFARPRLLRIALCKRSRCLVESRLFTRPGFFRSWLKRKCEASVCQQGGCEFFEGDFAELDSLARDRGAPLAHLTLKETAQTGTRTKQRTRKEDQTKICH